MRARLTLPDSPYAVGVTDLSRPLKPPAFLADLDGFTNRNGTSTIPFQLVANVGIRALPRNPRRAGLLINNLDPTTDLRYSFGNDQGANGLLIVPRGAALFDFTTPPDELYLFSTAAISVIVVDITRLPAPPKLRRA